MFKKILYTNNIQKGFQLFYFKKIYNFSSLIENLNPYLKKQITARNLIPLKDFQQKAFEQVQINNKNCFINSCTGSGKTLAYILPILNNILNQNQKKRTELNKKQNQILYEKHQRHGALIFTLNKQLALQIYKYIRLIDTENKLNVYRIGSISYFAPVIELLVLNSYYYQKNQKQKTRQDQEKIAENVDNNIVKCIDWTKTDILIATPQMFWNVKTTIAHNKSNPINPNFIAIDQADLLLQLDQNVSNYMHKIISQIKSPLKISNNKQNLQKQKNVQNKIKYLIASSSFPKKIKQMVNTKYLQKYFSPIEVITGVNKHRLPQRIELNYVQIQTQDQVIPGQINQRVLEQKLFYLKIILSDSLKKQNRFIIFCNNKKSVEKVSEFILNAMNLQCIQYYASLPSDRRSLNLYKFLNENFNILVSTDLGSRGLDFERPIHTVIQFDMSQNIVNFINRAGRTARNNMPGQIITFVQPKNKTFFQHLSSLSSQNQEFDQLFSRKRSYNKLLLKKQKQQI